ncbi:MAG: M81 family metallopeptidase [archaeon]
MRIAVASFSHETCTFCPKRTTIEDFEKGGVLYGNDVLETERGIPSYINGYIKAAEEEGAELIGILSAARAWGGSSGSWLTKECFDKYSNGIADGLRKAGKLNGVLLALHGGMAVEGHPRPEAEIVRRARKAVGKIPIMVTLDMHANEDEELTNAADAVFVIKTFPHVDSEETGLIAARCMIRTVKGEFTPTMAIKKPGIITPGVFQCTLFNPTKQIFDRARAWQEKEKDAYCVNVALGFPYADVPDAGATVIAVTNRNPGLAKKIVEDMSNFIWSIREPFANQKVPKTKEGIDLVLRAVREGKRPVVIADHGDRTGDGTHILKELLAKGAKNFAIATIADPHAIQEIQQKSQLGEKVTAKVGGYATRLSGEPIELTGTVEFLGDGSYVLTGPMSTGRKVNLETVAVLDLGNNNHVIITPVLHQVLDDSIIKTYGIDFNSLDIIVLKSRVHFRAFYQNVAKEIVPIDTPCLGPADLSTLPYRNVPLDLYPIGKKWRK